MRDLAYIQEHVTKSLHGKNTGPWSLGVKVYRDVNQNGNSRGHQMVQSSMHQQNAANKDSKLMYQVALGQQPGQVYCMVDGSVVVEAEKELEIILSRLKNLWVMRQNIVIEVYNTVSLEYGSSKISRNRVQVSRLAISRCEWRIFFSDQHTKACC